MILEYLQFPIIRFGDTVITPLALILSIVIYFLFWLTSYMLRKVLNAKIFTRLKLEQNTRQKLNKLIHYILMLTALIFIVNFLLPKLNIIQSVSTGLQWTLFAINQTPVTLLSLLMFALFIVLFALISQIFRRVLLKQVYSYLELAEGTQYTFSRIMHYLVMVIGALVAFQFIGINLGGLAVVFGFLSVGIGFGLQNVTSNFIAGLILLFERPIQVGDRVTVGDTEGDVQEINIRSTTIRSIDNISIIVPNSAFISSNVINWSYGDPKIRLQIEVGVSYNSDLDTVIRALEEVAEEEPEVLKKPQPEIHLESFGDSAWNMRLLVWINDPKLYRDVPSLINCAIIRKFRKYNIEIPFPQRDLNVRSPLPVPFSDNTGKEN